MNAPGRPIQSRVRESILQAIASGSIRPGQRLSIPALADTLGVSTTPIREALSALAGDGVLNLFPGGVAVVPAVTRVELEQWLWLRRAIESRLVECGLERTTRSEAVAIVDLASSVIRNELDAALRVQIVTAVIERIVALADQAVLEMNLRKVRNRCAAALAEGQHRAGAEAAITFATDIVAALLAGKHGDARISHSRYLDSIDAAALSIMADREAASESLDSSP